jgi:hypothetical protein
VPQQLAAQGELTLSLRSALTLAAALLLAAAPAPGTAADPETPAKGKASTRGAARKKAAQKAAKAAAGKVARGAAGKGRIGSLGGLQPGAAAPFQARPVAVRPLDTVGEVRTVQRGRAWVDAGAQEGLAVGQVLQLKRKGEPVGSCTVEAISGRTATCTGTGMRPGDTFLVNPRAAGSLPAQLPPVPGAEEQARRLAALQRAVAPPVDFKSTRVVDAPEPLRRHDVGYAHYDWLSSDAGAVHQEQLYAQVRGAEVWRGARLDLDLTAMARSAASEDSQS